MGSEALEGKSEDHVPHEAGSLTLGCSAERAT